MSESRSRTQASWRKSVKKRETGEVTTEEVRRWEEERKQLRKRKNAINSGNQPAAPKVSLH